jgi:dihydrolipoamide dehydrogenase
MARVLKRSGVTIHAASRVESIVADDTGVKLALASGKDILADKALVAIGRRPHAAASHDIELPATPRGGLAVDDHLRVRENIYAIGDLNDTWQLAHAAEHQGAWVARSIAGKTDSPYRTGPVPVCIYGAPETMRVGPTQEELAEDPTVFASKARLAANPISQAHGATHGFVKILWREERVISVIAVGHGVSRMTVAAQIMVEQGWARRQIEEMMFPHPTLDEALLAAARMEPQQVCPPPADDPECY